MEKTFNVKGVCYSDEHYMVDLTSRLVEIKKIVGSGKYFAETESGSDGNLSGSLQ